MSESTESPYIVAADAESFPALVVENSARGPVLVNFRSRADASCQRQFDLLDRLVRALDGRLLLVNVDVDAEAALARDLGVSDVPALKLFRKGRVVESRSGLQDEAALEALVQYYVARDSDEVIDRAVPLFAEGRAPDAFRLLGEAMAEDPVNPRLPLAVARLLHHQGRTEAAIRLLDSVPEGVRQYDELLQFRILLGFRMEAGDEDDAALQARIDATPDDPRPLRRRAARLVLAGEHAEALALLARLLEREGDDHESYARKAMLRVFALLDPDDPLRAEYGKYFQRYRH